MLFTKRIINNNEQKVKITDTEIIPQTKDGQLNLTHKINCIFSGPNNSPFQFGLFKFQIYMTFIGIEEVDVMDESFLKEDKTMAAKIVFGLQDFIYHPVFKNRVNNFF